MQIVWIVVLLLRTNTDLYEVYIKEVSAQWTMILVSIVTITNECGY
jgi:hypothetical protein